ncbi:Aste57867_17919 [Aphanomyces stellatus]|uniref:Aste57867_17919 protein n=1 Tax=Aphanomyces stellatus TaxID=120398 RepID=A0A485LA06_9STRA|nr:hypothetical protein As57867_017858 [Aphanomyces stellatus]VFT94661.1 Aste57867_17919 [Aphanomyces stellatus]
MANVWIAASDGNLDAVKAFLAAGTPVNAQDENGYTPLQAAVSYSHADIVHYLLAAGASATLGNSDNETPLHYCESVECAQILLQHGADINATNAEQRTPLDAAIDDENEELCAFLESHGAVSSGIVTEETASLAQLQAMMQAQEAAEAAGINMD